MAGTTLLDLSRRYAAGQLDFASYRQQRRSLIRQQLQATEERTLPAGGQRTAPPDPELTEERTRDFHPTAAASLAKPARRRRNALLAVVAVLVMVVLALGLYLAGPEAPASSSEAPPAARPPSPILAQVSGLLRQGDFTPGQLTELLQAWQGLDPEARRQLQSDRRHGQLLQLLAGQIQVLEALDPTGADAAVTARIARLTRVEQQLSAP